MKVPNNLFAIISTNFWMIVIIMTTVQAFVFKSRSKKYIQEKPQLSEGYEKIFRNFLLWGNVPWVVMGFGCVFGGVPSVFHYFNPREGNPYVLAWFGVVFLEWMMGTHWLFFQGGAQMLADHPGLIVIRGGGNITNPSLIKLLWLLCLAGGMVAVFMMWKGNFPMPSFSK